MGRKGQLKPLKTEDVAGDSGDGGNVVRKQRKRQVAWSQTDTERLCELLLEHGSGGILSKQTNATTNERKKMEWQNIASDFNANPQVFSLCMFCIFFSHTFSLSHTLECHLSRRENTRVSVQTRFVRNAFAYQVGADERKCNWWRASRSEAK